MKKIIVLFAIALTFSLTMTNVFALGIEDFPGALVINSNYILKCYIIRVEYSQANATVSIYMHNGRVYRFTSETRQAYVDIVRDITHSIIYPHDPLDDPNNNVWISPPPTLYGSKKLY